jgi:oligoendopeptidase F
MSFHLAPLPQSALDALDWEWSRFEPHFRELSARAIDAESVSTWLADWTRLASLVNEVGQRLHVAVDLHSDDQAARSRYFKFLEAVQQPALEAEQLLKEKLLASRLEPEGFAVPLRNMRTEADLFRKENVPLLTEHEKTALEYSRIVGDETVEWNGRELTNKQLVGELKGAERATRERGWRLGIERVLSDRQAINGVWVKLMDLRGRIAANAGMKDYREYMWRSRLRFDYTPGDCEIFHEAIEEVVVPAAARVYQRHGRLLGSDGVRPWDISVDVMRQSDINVDPFGRPALRPFDDVKILEDKAAAIFRKVDPRLGDYFETMRREGLYDLANYKGKAPGAYCTGFPVARRPFVLMNAAGGAGDVDTLLHEMGHAFHTFEVYRSPALPYHQLQDYPTEFAEVASMSMELLGSPYLTSAEGGFYTEEEAARAMLTHLEQLLLFWPYMAVVDGFQHWVYTNHAQASDPSECDATWSRLWDRFIKGVDWTGLDDAKATGWQRKLHIFHYPFYYVEYGLAQLGAVQVWRNALGDRRAAVTAYLKGLSLGYSVPLPRLFAATGANFAFDAGTLRAAVDLIEEQIGKLEPDVVDAPRSYFRS